MRQPVPFGKYLLLDRISVGGMAEVFKAKSYGVEGFEKIIAIKRILPTMGEDRDFIKMFIDEAKIAGQLAHANICQIFELGRIDGSHFIAMEYIWGKDLLQIQNRVRKLKQQLPVPMACFMIAKVLEGLDYAHRKRDPLGRPLEIVHRDCSPQNVLVSYEGEVKVIDFGIAKATSRNSRTMAGVLKGKFGYMSPEQVRGLPLDRRSDIFALGTMLYECLTGDRLFQGETDFSTLEKVRNVDVRPPREVNPKIPEAIEKIIMKALAKDTEDRYQWCSEMLADLQQFLMGQDVVFTAKSLAGWLKEVFQPEIEKERQLLEQYKRVGRDGLIAGVPAAEAKLDVVENLGEAGAPEGDATQLGGPSFDMEEQQVAAQPVVEPPRPQPVQPANPGIARINGKQPAAARAAAAAAPAPRPQSQAVPDDEFAEEQPTEIFGDHPTEADPVAAARSQTPNKPMPRAQPTPQMQVPLQPIQRPAPNASAATMVPGVPVGNLAGLAPAGRNANAATMLAGMPVGQPQQQVELGNAGYYPPSGPQHQMPVAPPEILGPAGASPMPMQPLGQPLNAIPLGPSGAPQQNPQARTLLGAPAPNLDQYRQQMPQQPPPQQYQPPPTQQQYPSYPQHQNGYPQQTPQPHQYSAPMQQPQGGYPQQNPMGYPMAPPGNPYGSGQQPQMPEAVVPVEGQKKKSSLGRDIAIGVVIAALVLGGFLIVKFFVLDSGSGDSSTTSTMATIRVQMSPGVTAELDIDGKKIGIVNNKDEIPVSGSADKRKVKLLGPGGQKCESEMKLPAGETTTLECPMTPVATPSTTGSAAAVAPPPATGSAGSAAPTVAVSTGSGGSAGSGSAAVKAPDPVKPTDPVVKAPDPTVKPPVVDNTKKPPDNTVVKPPDTTTHPDATKKPPDTTAHVDTTKKPPDTATPPVVHHDKMPEENTKSGDGYLEITSKPRAKISIDGNDTGLTTPVSGKALKLAPGKHKVTFYAGDDKFTFSVIVKPGESLKLDKVLQ